VTTRVLRKIVEIDEEKCDGCGVCIPSCVEGALQIVDGKAKLISEIYCDGLGACLGECPQDAITVVEREAAEFSEEAVEHHLEQEETVAPVEDRLPCGCPSTSVHQFEKLEAAEAAAEDISYQSSMLGHWPVQLTLVPPTAPFLQGADLLMVADCVPFAYAGFHSDLLRGHALLVACPKLDDFQAHVNKLTDILSQSAVKSLTVAYMEVPCCSALAHMVKQAIQQSGRDITLKEVIIGVQGDLKS